MQSIETVSRQAMSACRRALMHTKTKLHWIKKQHQENENERTEPDNCWCIPCETCKTNESMQFTITFRRFISEHMSCWVCSVLCRVPISLSSRGASTRTKDTHNPDQLKPVDKFICSDNFEVIPRNFFFLSVAFGIKWSPPSSPYLLRNHCIFLDFFFVHHLT